MPNKSAEKRIKGNKPCVNEKGQFCWPKINSASENNNAAQNNSDPNNEVGAVFFKKHHDCPHECKCHSSTDFEFVYYFHYDLQ